jgi:hypothetical protein
MRGKRVLGSPVLVEYNRCGNARGLSWMTGPAVRNASAQNDVEKPG